LAGRQVAWKRVKEGANMTKSAIANEMIELGRMSMAREDLTSFLRGRFPEVLTPDVERAIADQPSLALLREWVAVAGRARSPEEFLAVLRR
jgi:hypothetical protein